MNVNQCSSGAQFGQAAKYGTFATILVMELFVSLEPEDLEKIAHLARLRIEAQDIPNYTRSLSEILALVERMNSIDTEGVQPMAHPQNICQRLRADEITEFDQRDRFQKIAPQTEAGLYLVPKVIE